MDILKRLLNVVTIAFVIVLAIIIMEYILFENGGRSNTLTSLDTVRTLAILDIVMFVGVWAFNYIVFKKITLWHK